MVPRATLHSTIYNALINRFLPGRGRKLEDRHQAAVPHPNRSGQRLSSRRIRGGRAVVSTSSRRRPPFEKWPARTPRKKARKSETWRGTGQRKKPLIRGDILSGLFHPSFPLFIQSWRDRVARACWASAGPSRRRKLSRSLRRTSPPGRDPDRLRDPSSIEA